MVPDAEQVALDVTNGDTRPLGLRPKNIRDAVSDWKDNAACANSLPEITACDKSMRPLRGDVEKWVVKVGTYERLDQDESHPDCDCSVNPAVPCLVVETATASGTT